MGKNALLAVNPKPIVWMSSIAPSKINFTQYRNILIASNVAYLRCGPANSEFCPDRPVKWHPDAKTQQKVKAQNEEKGSQLSRGEGKQYWCKHVQKRDNWEGWGLQFYSEDIFKQYKRANNLVATHWVWNTRRMDAEDTCLILSHPETRAIPFKHTTPGC